MGRGSGKMELAASALDPAAHQRAGRPEFELLGPSTPPDIGSDSHRHRLEAYARARLDRSNITLRFSSVCGRCGHSEEAHTAEEKHCGRDSCPCDGYMPGGGSFTDMHGNITVQSDVPPDGLPEEKELCIRGFLHHEICHEYRTNVDVHRAFVKDYEEMCENGQEVTAFQIQRIWNCLEDGMIEEREREERPESYAFISAMNKIHPRVGKDFVMKDEKLMLAPEGYIPRDADGNELELVTKKAPNGSDVQLVKIPAGTKISRWGRYPIDPAQQMQSALLAESVPEFEPGEMHPQVEAALDECREHIDAAVRGNTADCVARAYPIHAIMRNYGFLREDLTDEERRQMEELAEMFGQMMPTAPEQGGPGDGDGEGQAPQNGIPVRVKGQKGMGRHSKQAMDGAGDEQGQGSGGKEDDEAEDEGQAAGGKGKNEQGEEQGGKSAGDDGDEDGDQDGDKPKDSERGGFEDSGGYNPSEALPQSTRERNQDQGKGSVSDADLDEMKKAARTDLERDKANQEVTETSAQRRGRFDANLWKMPPGHAAVSQRELRRQPGERPALADEEGELSTLGQQLSAQLRRVKTQTRAPQRYQRRGKLDTRRLGAAIAGNPKVFEKKGMNLDIDLEIDINIDRSGSVKGDEKENKNQFRMAKMFAVASKETGIPTTIYGWDGSGRLGGHTSHFAYKEAHSNDLTSLDSFFRTGGGGTPTAAGIEFARARLGKSKKRNRFLITITDGAANDIDAARAQVNAARAQGLTVIGMAFECSETEMDRQFGRGNWLALENYTDAPRIVGEMIRTLAVRASARR